MACLAAYNNGKLHGCWIDAIQDQINSMLASSPEEDAEEYAIHFTCLVVVEFSHS